jgi:hypothetical protein
MHRTIRLQEDGDLATLWADSTYLGQSPILLAELQLRDPHEGLDTFWYWVPASCVFTHWLSGARTVGSLREAEEIGLLFLRYLGELQTLLEVEI